MNSHRFAARLCVITFVAFGISGCANTGRSLQSPRQPAPDTPASNTADSKLSDVSVPQRKPFVLAKDVLGISEYEVASLFGSPAEVTDKAPAVVWRYPSQKCHLSLFFYMDVNTNALRVLTYEIEPEDTNAAQCIAAVQDMYTDGRTN